MSNNERSNTCNTHEAYVKANKEMKASAFQAQADPGRKETGLVLALSWSSCFSHVAFGFSQLYFLQARLPPKRILRAWVNNDNHNTFLYLFKCVYITYFPKLAVTWILLCSKDRQGHTTQKVTIPLVPLICFSNTMYANPASLRTPREPPCVAWGLAIRTADFSI